MKQLYHLQNPASSTLQFQLSRRISSAASPPLLRRGESSRFDISSCMQSQDGFLYFGRIFCSAKNRALRDSALSRSGPGYAVAKSLQSLARYRCPPKGGHNIYPAWSFRNLRQGQPPAPRAAPTPRLPLTPRAAPAPRAAPHAEGCPYTEGSPYTEDRPYTEADPHTESGPLRQGQPPHAEHSSSAEGSRPHAESNPSRRTQFLRQGQPPRRGKIRDVR
jgi:hypothetical protein